jgi:DNA-binding GntR family transcriptional regulator
MNFPTMDRQASPFAVSSGGSAATRIYLDLRQRIIDLNLPPDTTLSRGDLTERYKVSQTPVREALQRLEQDGLVKIFPQSRTLVTRIDEPQMYEAYFLRIAVETEVMRRLAHDCDPSVISKAKSIVRMQHAIVHDIDQIDMFYDFDEAFHKTLFDGVGQSGLHQLLQSKSGHLGRIRRLGPPPEGKFDMILKGHAAIIAGIESGDENQAMAAIRDHLKDTVSISRVKALRSQFPDYFGPA